MSWSESSTPPQPPEDPARRSPAISAPVTHALPIEPAGPAHARLTFRQRHRLTHAREFQLVFAEGVKRYRGPITLLVRPSLLAQPRLGLSISGRVGPAVVRNRLKRLIREAFRLEQRNLARPGGGTSYDIVVTARPHELKPLTAYRRMLLEMVAEADQSWASRRRGQSAPAAPGRSPPSRDAPP